MNGDRHLRAWRNYVFGDAISVDYYEFTHDHKVTAATLVTMETVDEGGLRVPLFKLTPSMAQELIDDLWQCGVRPSEGSGSAGQLAAVQKHLEDMRSLVWKAPKP